MTLEEHIQETADCLHISIWRDREGLLYHLKPGQTPPPGAKVWGPQAPWHQPIHGKEQLPAAPAAETSTTP